MAESETKTAHRCSCWIAVTAAAIALIAVLWSISGGDFRQLGKDMKNQVEEWQLEFGRKFQSPSEKPFFLRYREMKK